MRHGRADVAIPVDHAPLPAGLGVKSAQRLDQAQALVAGDQPHAPKTAFFEMAQEVSPARGVLLNPFANAQYLAIAVLVDADRHQHRHVLHFAAPRAFQPHAVEGDLDELSSMGSFCHGSICS